MGHTTHPESGATTDAFSSGRSPPFATSSIWATRAPRWAASRCRAVDRLARDRLAGDRLAGEGRAGRGEADGAGGGSGGGLGGEP